MLNILIWTLSLNINFSMDPKIPELSASYRSWQEEASRTTSSAKAGMKSASPKPDPLWPLAAPRNPVHKGDEQDW